MKLKKRILSLMAIVVLMGSSLMAFGTSVAGNEIETSITVLETGCVDDPTSISLSVTQNPTWNPDTAGPSAWIGTGMPAANTGNAVLNMNVSECAGGWSVNATVTDFKSAENNIIASPDRFYLVVQNYNGMAKHYSGTVCLPGIPCFPGVAEHLGTWGPIGPVSGSGAYGNHVYFGGAGPEYTTLTTHPLMSGDETAVGEMWGNWGVRWDNMYTIRDTPPGEYVGVLKMTFTPVNP